MTYEYACSACGHAWEAEQSISAAPLTECPHCHQATAKRQVSGGAGFILKGGGWYADLYSSSSKSGAGDSKSSSESKPASTESKPASTESKSDSTSSSSGGSSGSGSSTTGAAST